MRAVLVSIWQYAKEIANKENKEQLIILNHVQN